MAIFCSFHYRRDNWRVQQVLNMGAIDAQPILSVQDWEAVERKGDAEVKKWIEDQMAYKKALVVLVGAETAGRRWVKYEITKAWNDKKPIVGIRINGLADKLGVTDSKGANPFAGIVFDSGGSLADYITLQEPSGTTGKEVYAAIQKNLTTWVDGAYKRQ